MAKNVYSTTENGKQIEVEVKDYDLPFYRFQKTSKTDPTKNQ